MAYDKLEKTAGSLIHHGPCNDRVYLMKCNEKNPVSSLEMTQQIAEENNYGKIFAKIPSSHKEVFTENSFEVEAEIPNFYSGKEDACFMSKYLDSERAEIEKEEIDSIVELARKKGENAYPIHDMRNEIIELSSDHSEEIVGIYKEVFETYPFPIFDETYINECLETNFRMFGLLERGELVSIASCEMDVEAKNVEMTDFATRPAYRGKGHALEILNQMNKEMGLFGMKTAYTIARAKSPAMNITFAKSGYNYSGTLKNNTDIAGEIESMNVWYRSL